MDHDVQVERVCASRRGEALRHLAAGRRRGAGAGVGAEAYERMIAASGGLFELWWARLGEPCRAVALVVASAGRTGMLFHSPAERSGAEGAARQAIIAACGAGLDRGLSLVQSLVEPARRAEAELLESAGFRLLAELVYMRLALGSRPVEQAEADAWTWRDAEQFGEEELSDVIRLTYEDSWDCPGLRGVRRLADVIAGHRASGLYSPRSWWIVSRDGRAAGCVLANDSAGYTRQMELVYMGVGKAFRGRGLGRGLVARAARWAQQQQCTSLSVAVDVANPYAMRIYEQLGFHRTDRRLAYMLLGRSRG